MTEPVRMGVDRRRPPALGRVGYGGADLGNLYRPMTDEEAWAVLDAAWDSGIRYFDTAPHYGLGLSERRLGAFLATKPRAEFVLSTKVGRLLRPSPETAAELDVANHYAVPASLRRVWDFSPDGVRRCLDESLERLGLDAVDILFLHDPDESGDLARAISDGVAALVSLREEGRVAAIGVGSKSTAALVAGVRTGCLDVVMVAGRYTLVEQPALDELFPLCDEHRVDVIAAGAFNSGLLAAPAPGPHAKYEYVDVPPDVLRHVHRLESVCAEYDVDLPVAALQFVLRAPLVRCVVLGGAEPRHVRENVERARTAVPDELWERLTAESLVRT